MSAHFQLPAREVGVMQRSLFRLMPTDPTAHLYRAHVPVDALPETGVRESFRQLFGPARRRQQRQRALAWIFQHRGIEA